MLVTHSFEKILINIQYVYVFLFVYSTRLAESGSDIKGFFCNANIFNEIHFRNNQTFNN